MFTVVVHNAQAWFDRASEVLAAGSFGDTRVGRAEAGGLGRDGDLRVGPVRRPDPLHRVPPRPRLTPPPTRDSYANVTAHVCDKKWRPGPPISCRKRTWDEPAGSGERGRTERIGSARQSLLGLVSMTPRSDFTSTGRSTAPTPCPTDEVCGSARRRRRARRGVWQRRRFVHRHRCCDDPGLDGRDRAGIDRSRIDRPRIDRSRIDRSRIDRRRRVARRTRRPDGIPRHVRHDVRRGRHRGASPSGWFRSATRRAIWSSPSA